MNNRLWVMKVVPFIFWRKFMINRILIGIIIAGFAIGGLQILREPIYTISIQTTLQFDIVSLIAAFLVGFISAAVGLDKKEEPNVQQ